MEALWKQEGEKCREVLTIRAKGPFSNHPIQRFEPSHRNQLLPIRANSIETKNIPVGKDRVIGSIPIGHQFSQ